MEEKEKLLDEFFNKLSEEDVKKLKEVDADILMALDNDTIKSFNSLDDYLKFKKTLKNESKPDPDKVKSAFKVGDVNESFNYIYEKMIDKRIERQKRKGEEYKASAERHKENSEYSKKEAKHHEEDIHSKSGKNKRSGGFKGFLQTIGRSMVQESDYKTVKDENGNTTVVPDYDAIQRHEFERAMCGMCSAIEKEKDPKKKQEAQLKFDIMMQGVVTDDKGRPCGAVIDKELCRKHGIFPDDIKDDLSSQKMQTAGKNFQLDYDGDFRKDFSQLAKSYTSARSEMRKALEEEDLQKWHEKRSQTLQKRKDNGTNLGARLSKLFSGGKNASSPEKKEEVVKDKDGSEIIARAKKNGDGKTFVRKKNGKEIGYATKDEFQAAKKKANESINRDLRNYIYECLEK